MSRLLILAFPPTHWFFNAMFVAGIVLITFVASYIQNLPRFKPKGYAFTLFKVSGTSQMRGREGGE